MLILSLHTTFGHYRSSLRRTAIHVPALVLSIPHIDIQHVFFPDQFVLSDEFDPIVAAEALPLLRLTLVFVNLKHAFLVGLERGITIFCEDVELYKVHPFVIHVNLHFQSLIRCFIIIYTKLLQPYIKLEHPLVPEIFRVFVVNYCVKAYHEKRVSIHLDLNTL